MYAVIETGGKQYRVEVGTELEVERLAAGPGESVAFDRVLLIADGESASIGRPVVANASVAAEVVRRERGEKLISFKYRPKARRRVKKGHRQELTLVRISDIVLDGRSAAADAAKAEEDRKTERQRLEEAARRQAAKDAELAAKLLADDAPSGKAKAPARAHKADTTDNGDARASSRKPAAKAEAGAEAKAEGKGAAKSEAKASGETKRASDQAAQAKPARARKTETGKTETEAAEATDTDTTDTDKA